MLSRPVTFGLLLGLLSTTAAWAQAPTISTVVPMANASAIPPASPLTVSFSQPLTAASAGALKVFSSQRGGLRTSTAAATVAGNALSFAPVGQAFMPGEKVSYSVTTAAASPGGPLGRARVGQFTTGVSSSPGTFVATPTTDLYTNGEDVAVGDLDADGDLDLAVAAIGDSVMILLNNGRGSFRRSRGVKVEFFPGRVLLDDVDGDGDLDVLAGLAYSTSVASGVSIRLNDGNGHFSVAPSAATGSGMMDLTAGDLDGDGDLDLVFAQTGSSGTVKLHLNNGRGVFMAGSTIPNSPQGYAVSLADIDNDGDLDLLTANYTVAQLGVYLNDGQGQFTLAQNLSVATFPRQLATGDIDRDGDVDVIVAHANSTGTVSVCRNSGTGAFSNAQTLTLTSAYSAQVVELGDIDGDQDLDLLVASSANHAIYVYANDGTGSYQSGPTLPISASPSRPRLGDLDGDGDLDLATVTSNYLGTVNIFLNSTATLATTAARTGTIALFPNPNRGAAQLTGAAPYASLVIFDVLGRAVLTTQADARGTAHLQLPANCRAGAYLVRISTAHATTIQRLLVE